MLLLSVPLFHLRRLLLVLPLHLLHLSGASVLLRQPLVIRLLLLRKLFMLLLLLGGELLLPLLGLSLRVRVCRMRRGRSRMLRNVACMNRSGRSRNVGLRTCSRFIRRTCRFVRRT